MLWLRVRRLPRRAVDGARRPRGHRGHAGRPDRDDDRARGDLSRDHTLDKSVAEAPWFYATYASTLLAAAAVVLSGTSLLTLSVYVQVMNPMLLPIVLSLQGWRAHAIAGVMGVTVVLGLYAGVAGLFT